MADAHLPGTFTAPPYDWRYSRVLRPILIFGAVAHAVFLLLFLALDVMPMVAFNVASTALYITLLNVATRLDSRVFITVAVVEVLLHAWLATRFVGWESGFHLYPLILLPLIAFLTTISLTARFLAIAGVTVAYALIALLYTTATPVAPLPDAVAPWLSAANVVLVSVGLSVFILFYAVAVRNADELARTAHDRLEALAATDPLTGLLNRRSMDEQLRAAIRARQPAAALLVDIDRFKRINDDLGHDTGDLVIQAVAAVLEAGTRDEDAVARWGGEEFLVLLRGHDQEAAWHVSERLRARVPESWSAPPGHRLTVSIGVAAMRPGDSADTLISRADTALLQAKRDGRNRTAATT